MCPGLGLITATLCLLAESIRKKRDSQSAVTLHRMTAWLFGSIRKANVTVLAVLSSDSVITSKEIPELWFPVPLVMCMKTYYRFNRTRLLSHLCTSFCALAIAGALLTFPSAEAGGPPLPASGGFFPCFNFAGPPRQVGENTIITFNVSGAATGTFTGSSTGTELDVVHRDGSITLHGTLLFTGSINGRSGTLLLSYEGIGNAVTGHETLRFVGREGTGDLAGIYANVTAEGDVGAPEPGCDLSGAGTYNGHVVFAR